MTEIADVCKVCQKNVDDDLVLLCDGCNVAIHTYCQTGCFCCKKKPNLFGKVPEVPEGEFFCKLCKGRTPVPEPDKIISCVYAFGNNEGGQLGIGEEGKGTNKNTPTLVADLAGVEVKQAALGGWNSAVLTSTGDVYSCGDGTQGKTGHPDMIHEALPRYRKIEKLDEDNRPAIDGSVIHLVGGRTFFGALVQGGSLYTWGDGEKGQLAHQSLTAKKIPTKISALVELEFGVQNKIACGWEHMLAVSRDAGIVGDEILMCWGSGKMGQLGRGDVKDKWVPQLLNPTNTYDLGESYYSKPSEEWKMGTVKQVAAGKYHSLALTNSGEVWSWGCAASGQLGHGMTETTGQSSLFARNYTNLMFPTRIEALKDKVVVDIFSGADHCLALTADHQVYAWGANRLGQCGTGSGPSNVWLPVEVKALSPEGDTIDGHVVKIAVGDNHNIALTSTNKLYTWGSGRDGQLGLGSNSSVETPKLLNFAPSLEVKLNDTISIFAGGDHSMIVFGTVNKVKIVKKRKLEEEEKKPAKGPAKKAAKTAAKTAAPKKKPAKKSKKEEDSETDSDDDTPIAPPKKKKAAPKKKASTKKK